MQDSSGATGKLVPACRHIQARTHVWGPDAGSEHTGRPRPQHGQLLDGKACLGLLREPGAFCPAQRLHLPWETTHSCSFSRPSRPDLSLGSPLCLLSGEKGLDRQEGRREGERAGVPSGHLVELHAPHTPTMR